MDESYLEARFFTSVEKHIASLKIADRAKIQAAVEMLRRKNFNAVSTKTLKGKIRELIVRRFRLIYFLKGGTLYFVSIFVKKSAKTPQREIQNAEKLYKQINQTT